VSITGIGAFTFFLKAVKPRGGDIVFVAMKPKVYEVFELLGFSRFFNFKDTLQEALDESPNQY
jgi:anti-anti-sigma regulatory factor